MSKRVLRSDTAAEKAAANTTKSIEPTPEDHAPKKQKSTTPKFTCTCCGDEKTARSFPNYTPTPECEHLINTCRTCLRQWIEVQVDSAKFFSVSGDQGATFGIKCVECKEMMRPVNVELAASKAVYERFDRLAKRKVAERIPNWRWCLAPLCDNGQEHVKAKAVSASHKKAGKGKGKGKKRDIDIESEDAAEADNICTCNKCGAQACASCDVSWHDGETCQEYKDRTQNEQDEASLAMIRNSFKKCPSCSKSIEKNGGCDYMQCTQCSKAFCWRCVQLFQHGQFCACHPAPPNWAQTEAGLFRW
ncbi:hypothetical protein CERZMDRAFT_94928 [Cercospora zeae-maydis SCOH1-5]|uniref:RBR-type E3 ubiquitin transferase n=1 Tax=Cercospora zeae-maydis SCOH1-5 TaxID=717836 RepID=A0A6A6FPZ4_9PEZI|nr:hypothetical protein CERZMDRAFT_94928 [Cercospora zeae-maydis SCOH1-5]